MIALERNPACLQGRRGRLAFGYRCLFYALAATPIWGAFVTLAIVWHRTRL
jgi:hypothetical protein